MIGLVLCLTACAGGNNGIFDKQKFLLAPTALTYDQQHSVAENVTAIAGIWGVRDGQAELADVKKNRHPTGDSLAIGMSGLTAYNMANAVSFGSGLTSGAVGALGILSAGSGETPLPGLSTHIIAFIPASAGTSFPKAAEAAEKIIVEATTHAFAPDGSLSPRMATFQSMFGRPSSYQVFVRSGCPEFHDSHHDAWQSDCSAGIYEGYPRPNPNLIPVEAPGFLKGQEKIYPPLVYTMPSFYAPADYASGASLDEDRNEIMGYTWSRSREGMMQLSAGLPAWMYIYLPPSQTEPAVILNEGQLLRFIKPT